MDNSRQITTIEQLRNYAQGQIVELPPFANNMPFTARLKRPSLLAMMKAGKIPNTLMNTANALFENTTHQTKSYNNETYAEVFQIMEILIDAALIEPTRQQVIDAGLELTDDQMMYIFNYTQQGVQAIKSFRQFKGDTTDIEHDEYVQGEA